jgi:hypothetical protein
MPNGRGGDSSSFEVDPERLAEEIISKKKVRELEKENKRLPDELGGARSSHRKPNGHAELAIELVAAPEFPVMAEEAYYGPAGEIVELIKPLTESDPVFLLINLHVFFGNAIGRGPHYMVEGTPHYPIFDALFVGATSKARKGTGDGRVRQVFALADPDWYRHRIQSGLSSGEGLIWEVRDPITKTVKGAEEVVDEGVPDKRLLVVQSEFAGVLQAIRREGSLLSTVMRDAWDGKDLKTLVKHSPAHATAPHISIVGHITSTELRYLMDRISMANGLGNRFLIACVKRSNVLPFGGCLSVEKVRDLSEIAASAIIKAREIEEVGWSEDGAEGWAAIYGQLSEGRPGLFGALTARAEAQVVRLAQTYALWDGAKLMTLDHLKAAQAVWNYCEASVRYIFGDSLGNPVADTILTALKNAGSEGLTRSDISGLFSRNESSGQIWLALKELAGLGLVGARREDARGVGRPAEIWVYTSDSPSG